MSLKIVALAALSTVILADAAQAQAVRFAYTPANAQYRVTTSTKASQEMGGQKQEFEINSNQLISLALAPKAKDTLAVTFTIDSANITSTAPAPMPDMTKLIGSKVTGAISTLGKVYSFQLPTVDDGMGGQSFEGFRSFLVRFPSAAVKPGLAWTDTTELKNSANGADLTTQVISTNKVVGDTTVNGEKAWKVQRTAAITTSGSGSQGGQAFVIEGKGTGTSTEYVSVKGVYLGSNGSQNADMTISVPGAGMTIPMTRVATTKVELVKK